ncbi:legumain-like [Daktulosphaira vitifoliae]|uniref:legumain-like n=1 Tax=Daktulosphaira vitifoliae TaxID=58002 RepID=UPI0021AAB5ED|nr:legumain-like [Daktulosphaira vitifoliae]
MGILSFLLASILAIGSLGYENDDNLIFIGKKWVFLISGSSGWDNYRHQADIAHAYQIVKRNGIPDENIIVMMADDVANHTNNPVPGTLINQPDGVDVYKGIKIDYSGKDVNSENFLNVLKGHKSAMKGKGSERVIESRKHDHVFVNFVDHGSNGILGFPDTFLYADDLIMTLKEMHAKRRYRKMVLFIEACNAGSMFDGLIDDDTKIIAVTASGPRECSYACYCDESEYHTCLGDLFNVKWMENLDQTIFDVSTKSKTILRDFEEIRTNVTNSNVMVYGDFHVGFEKLSKFIGYNVQRNSQGVINYVHHHPIKAGSLISNRNIPEIILNRKLANSKNIQEIKSLMQKINHRNQMKQVIDAIFFKMYNRIVEALPALSFKIGTIETPAPLKLSIDVFPCYKNIINTISSNCFSLAKNPYVLKKLKILSNMCVVDSNIDKIIVVIINDVCSITNIPNGLENIQ